MKKLCSTLALGLMTLSAVHAENVNETAGIHVSRWEDGAEPRLLSAQPDTDRGLSPYSKTELLVMCLYQSDLDYAMDGENTSGVPFASGRVHNLNFGFDVGVRQTWGVHGADNGWDMHFTHTHFGARNRVQIEEDEGLLWPLLWHSSEDGPNAAEEAYFRQKMEYITLDWIVAHSFFVNDHLALSPYAGVRVLLLDQDQHAVYSGRDFNDGDDEGHVHYNSKTNGWGVTFGSEASWHIGSGFCLFGRGAGSVLAASSNWGLRHTHDDDEIVELKEQFRNMRTGMEAAVGFSFEKEDPCAFMRYMMLSFAFEFTHWNNMDAARRFYGHADSGEHMGGLSSPSDHSHLGFWGFVFGARFDF